MVDQTAGRDKKDGRLAAWSAALWLAAAANAAAAAEHAAHVHGVTKLNVAIEGETVEMELIAPGADIVGFEHEPESAKDKAAVKSATATLEDGAGLFVFPQEADCRLMKAEVESAALEHDHGDDHAEKSHGEEHAEEAHGEEHADKGHGEEHAHEAHGDEHAEEAHGEFHARYRFRCTRPDRLTHVDVRFFEKFPLGRELDAQTISPRGQSAQELTASSMRLKL